MVPSAAKNTCFKIEENTTYAFSNSANTFDRNLFQEILSEKKNQNIILSSHSVSSVLSMILIGAKVRLVKEWVVKSKTNICTCRFVPCIDLDGILPKERGFMQTI